MIDRGRSELKGPRARKEGMKLHVHSCPGPSLIPGWERKDLLQTQALKRDGWYCTGQCGPAWVLVEDEGCCPS